MSSTMIDSDNERGDWEIILSCFISKKLFSTYFKLKTHNNLNKSIYQPKTPIIDLKHKIKYLFFFSNSIYFFQQDEDSRTPQ